MRVVTMRVEGGPTVTLLVPAILVEESRRLAALGTLEAYEALSRASLLCRIGESAAAARVLARALESLESLENKRVPKGEDA